MGTHNGGSGGADLTEDMQQLVAFAFAVVVFYEIKCRQGNYALWGKSALPHNHGSMEMANEEI